MKFDKKNHALINKPKKKCMKIVKFGLDDLGQRKASQQTVMTIPYSNEVKLKKYKKLLG